MALDSLKSFLPGVLGEIGVTPKNFGLVSLVENELTALGGRAHVVGFKENTIYVEVDSSALLQECSLRKMEILKSISGSFPIDGIVSPPELKFFLRGLARVSARHRIGKARKNLKVH